MLNVHERELAAYYLQWYSPVKVAGMISRKRTRSACPDSDAVDRIAGILGRPEWQGADDMEAIAGIVNEVRAPRYVV